MLLVLGASVAMAVRTFPEAWLHTGVEAVSIRGFGAAVMNCIAARVRLISRCQGVAVAGCCVCCCWWYFVI